MSRTLIELLANAAARRPRHVAVEDLPDGAVTYAELDALSDRARDRFKAMGVTRGDRVGISLRKSIDAYAALLGAMKAGAAYVPIDPAFPVARAAYIVDDCALRALVLDASLMPAWMSARPQPLPPTIELTHVGGGHGLRAALDQLDRLEPAAATDDAGVDADDLAYVLYTSGSTGTPKGVMLTHACSISHVEWCSEVLAPGADERFSSHAPFHFDLSISDLYVPLRHGATVVLIDADHGREPMRLAQLISERQLTSWYSTPTVLTVLSQAGKMERHDYSALRRVLFAGEVFPVKHLRLLRAHLPAPAFFNLYGPTETNVCTWHRLPPAIEAERVEPYPIGRPCAPFRVRVVDEGGVDVAQGSSGELIVHGPGTMRGYWGDPGKTSAAFLVDGDGTRWYRTGDLVRQEPDGSLIFSGRRDRMIKRRGYRIELGDIEAALYGHPSVKEAAVLATPTDEGVLITACLAYDAPPFPSELAMRMFCTQKLPSYMLPDRFSVFQELPKTSTDKIDYRRLSADAAIHS